MSGGAPRRGQRELPRRVLITGGAGFIGSHLAEALVEAGCTVTALDDLSTGSQSNLRGLLDDPCFTLRVGSAADAQLLGELFSQVDACVHLAAVVGVKLVAQDPTRALEVNVRCAHAVLAAAARSAAPVVLGSSSEVYGPHASVPHAEDRDLGVAARGGAYSAYAVSKLYGERLALTWSRHGDVPVTVARLFNTSGPRQVADHGMVLPTLVRQALTGRPLTVFGDGTQTRCFAHVRDTAAILVQLLAHPTAAGEIYNVGSDDELPILELARRVRRRAASASEIVLVPYEQTYRGDAAEDVSRRVPSLGKLGRLIGCRARVGVDAIIDDVLDYQARLLSEISGGGTRS